MENSKKVNLKELLGYSVLHEFDNQYHSVKISELSSSYEKNPDWKSPVYIEHELLVPVHLIDVYELDIDGRHRESHVGVYEVKPEHFDITLNETFDKTKHYYSYKLNDKGYDHLQSKGMKVNGWTSFDLIPESDIEDRKRIARETLEATFESLIIK